MADVYIYILRDPRRPENIRYVGKTVDPATRLKDHLKPSQLGKTTHKNSWIKGILRAGYTPEMIVIQTVPETTWPEWERYWITRYREEGHNLTNMAEGGEGISNTPEIMAKRLAARKLANKPAWNKGIPTPHPPSWKFTKRNMAYWDNKTMPRSVIEQAAIHSRGKPPSNKGIPRTEETRRKLSKLWIVTTPNGETETIRNMKTYCKEHSLSLPNMCKVAKGERPNHKGYTCRYG